MKDVKEKSMLPSSLEMIVQAPYPASGVQPVEIVFVHGSCHTAFCWHHFQETLAQGGYRSLAFSLRGHGNSQEQEDVLRNRLQDYVADLEHITKENVSQPFVLVGHSFGGYIVQSYLYQQILPRPVGTILLACSTPLQARILSRDVRTIIRNVRPFLQALITGNARALYQSPEEVRRWFFTPQTSQEIVEWCFRQLQDESVRASADILRLPSPENISPPFIGTPLTFLGAESDAIIPPSSIQASATAYQTTATIFSHRGHDLMLDQGWEEVVEHMMNWIKDHFALHIL